MRDTDPAGYRALGASMHVRIGYYESGKTAANAIGVDVSGGAA